MTMTFTHFKPMLPLFILLEKNPKNFNVLMLLEVLKRKH